MSVDDQKSRLVSRADMVPRFESLIGRIKPDRQRMQWIPSGTPLTVQGVKTQGGFYLQPAGSAPLSFAVDPSLPVGRPDQARPLLLRPGECPGYWQLDLHQRALFLHWLANAEISSRTSLTFCTRLYVSGLEWRLFIDRVPPATIISDLLTMVDGVNEVDRAPLLRLLVWCAYFHHPAIHLDVLEEILADGCRSIDGHILRLAIADCAVARRPLWPELALAIENVYGSGFDRTVENTAFQKRFLERFRVLYPRGLPIGAGPGRTQAEYRIICPEFRGERCCLEVLNGIENTSLRPTLREITRPIIDGPRLDLVKLQQIHEATVRVEKFLEARTSMARESMAISTPAPCAQPFQPLDQRSVDALRELAGRPQWTSAEFRALAKARGIMPLALQERLNAWALDNFGETLLEGEGPVVVNTPLLERLNQTYEQNQ